MILKKLFFVLAVGIAATSAMAQGFRGGMGGGMMTNPVFLLGRDDVRSDLTLTDDQKNKLAELRDSMMADFQAARADAGEDRDAQRKAMGDVMKKETDKVNAILTPDQQRRLKQIGLQIGGFGAIVRDKDLQTQLGLTDDQKTKMTDLATTADAANQAVGEKMRNQEIDRDEAMASFRKNGDALNAGAEAILTADQKAKFKDMQGKHFEAAPQPAFGGRPGGG